MLGLRVLVPRVLGPRFGCLGFGRLGITLGLHHRLQGLVLAVSESLEVSARCMVRRPNERNSSTGQYDQILIPPPQ